MYNNKGESYCFSCQYRYKDYTCKDNEIAFIDIRANVYANIMLLKIYMICMYIYMQSWKVIEK